MSATPTTPQCGVHKDGSYYLRATEPGHAKAIQDAAKASGVDLEHRKGPANSNGDKGTFDHYHAKEAGHIQTVLKQLHSAGEGEPDQPSDDQGEAGQDGGQHIHIHLHHGESEEKPEAQEEEPEAEEKNPKERPIKKAMAYDRTVNGKVIHVNGYGSATAKPSPKTTTSHRVPHQPSMLEEPERPKVQTSESVEHHRGLAEASSLRARVASHEAKDQDSHRAARDHHYSAATSHLRAAHSMIAHGHETEHPDVKAHLTKAQGHHDQALAHFREAHGKIDHGRQTTIDEAIKDADKRELRKAQRAALTDLLALGQRWNVRSQSADSRHQMLDAVPGALTTTRTAALAHVLGASSESILHTLNMATGGNLDYAQTMACMLEEDEGTRSIAKALRAVHAYFRPGHNGRLDEVRTYMRQESDAAHEKGNKTEIARTYSNMMTLLQGKNGPQMLDFSSNVHIGKIACTREMMVHIWQERAEAHQRDPHANPEPAVALKHIAASIVCGSPLKDPTTHPDQPDRVWLTQDAHQVSVAPFWNQIPSPKAPVKETDRAWIVTGFRMEPARVKAMETFSQAPELQVPITQFVEAMP